MPQPIINSNGQNVSTHSASTLKDLVFNPETGDFEQVDRGTANEGDTVTRLTEDGFALSNSDGFNDVSKDDDDKTSDNSISILKDLVFNPETGEFEVVERTSVDTSNQDGFICFLPKDSFC